MEGRFLDINVTNGQSISAVDPFWKNKVSAVKIREGCTFKGYRDLYFQDPIFELTESTKRIRCLDGEFCNDVLASWSCDCGGGKRIEVDKSSSPSSDADG